MSRLTKKPIAIEAGVTVTEQGGFLNFKGPKGERKLKVMSGVKIRIEGENLWVEIANKDVAAGPNPGTFWSLSKNAVEGVSKGFTKILEIEGVGYRAALEGKDLVLFLGYAQPVRVKILEDVTIAVEKNTIKVSGIDNDRVGRMAAEIRALKKPEPYKGKGIHYKGEVIRRKIGKKAGAGAAA